VTNPIRFEIQMRQMGFWPPFQIRGKPAIAAAGPSTAGGWKFYGEVVKLIPGLNFQVSGDRLKSQQVDAPNFRAVALALLKLRKSSTRCGASHHRLNEDRVFHQWWRYRQFWAHPGVRDTTPKPTRRRLWASFPRITPPLRAPTRANTWNPIPGQF
jgi:hypothetical protein